MLFNTALVKRLNLSEKIDGENQTLLITTSALYNHSKKYSLTLLERTIFGLKLWKLFIDEASFIPQRSLHRHAGDTPC